MSRRPLTHRLGRAAGRAGGWGFILVFVGFWTAGTIFFDIMIGTMIVNQARTLSYAETTGVITQSDVVRRQTSDGSNYAFEVLYDYTVDGTSYTSDAYRPNDISSSSHGDMARLAARFPSGATVPVYYDADDPSHAALARGVSRMAYNLILFMGPFNAVSLIGLSMIGGSLLRIGGPPSPIRSIERDPRTLRIRFVPCPFGIFAIIPWFFPGIPMILLNAFLEPPPMVPLIELGALIVLSAAVPAFMKWRYLGVTQCEIDHLAREVRINRRPPVLFDVIADIRRTAPVRVDQEEGPKCEVELVVMQDESEEVIRLLDDVDPNDADDVVDTIRAVLTESGAMDEPKT